MEAALTGPLGRFVLSTTKVSIGRAPDNTLILNDARVSSHHAEIRPDGPFYSLVDLGSTNGTFVNDQQVSAQSPHRLQSGDRVRFGDTNYTFDSGGAVQGRYPTSDGSTVRATPPSLGLQPPSSSGNTSYGGANANYDEQAYMETFIPQSSQQTPYMPPPPQPQPPLVLGNQLSYSNPAYGEGETIPSFMNQPSAPIYPQQSSPPQPSAPIYPQQPSPPQYVAQQLASPPLPRPEYNPPAPQPKRRSLWLTIVLVIIALLLILGAGGGFLIHSNQVAQDNTNATATANVTSTANAQTTTTALAVANAHASATAGANLTATAVATSHFPPFTALAFHDALTSDTSQWPSNSTCQFTTTGYQISIAQSGNFEWCSPTANASYSDFAFQVTMSIQSGDCGGLIFRRVDNNNFYIVLICSDGTYDLGLFQNNKPLWANSLTARPSSTAIHQGIGQKNVVALVVQGTTFNLYVNDFSKVADTFTDSNNTFTKGSIGLLANDFTNPTSVKYSDVMVWTQ